MGENTDLYDLSLLIYLYCTNVKSSYQVWQFASAKLKLRSPGFKSWIHYSDLAKLYQVSGISFFLFVKRREIIPFLPVLQCWLPQHMI